jgi:hypothetical protein
MREQEKVDSTVGGMVLLVFVAVVLVALGIIRR